MTITSPTFRARNIPELLDLAIRLYRRNFLTFVGIIATMQVPIVLVQLLLSLATFSDIVPLLQDPTLLESVAPQDILTPTFWGGIVGTGCLTFVSLILVQGIATAAMTRAVADNYLGQPSTILGAYRSIGRSWLRLVFALFLATILAIGFLIWAVVPLIGWLTGIGIFLFWTFVVIPLIAPIVVLEGPAVGVALRRAWDLARRRFWRILGFVVVLFLLGQLLITVPVTLVNWLLQLVIGNPLSPNVSNAFAIQTTVQSLTTLGFTLIYLPLQITGITLMYFDLRIRTEGFDLALATAEVVDHQTTLSEIVGQTPEPDRGAIITGKEFWYFVLVSLLGGGGFLILFAIFGVLIILMASLLAGGGGF